MADLRPPITARDIPAIVACYALVWGPIVALIFFPDATERALVALLAWH